MYFQAVRDGARPEASVPQDSAAERGVAAGDGRGPRHAAASRGHRHGGAGRCRGEPGGLRLPQQRPHLHRPDSRQAQRQATDAEGEKLEHINV